MIGFLSHATVEVVILLLTLASSWPADHLQAKISGMLGTPSPSLPLRKTMEKQFPVQPSTKSEVLPPLRFFVFNVKIFISPMLYLLLFIFSAPPSSAAITGPSVVNPQTDFEYTCTVVGGSPAPEISWNVERNLDDQATQMEFTREDLKPGVSMIKVSTGEEKGQISISCFGENIHGGVSDTFNVDTHCKLMNDICELNCMIGKPVFFRPSLVSEYLWAY